MKAILAIVTLLGLAAATAVYGAQQTGPAPENGEQATAQERDRLPDRTSLLTQAEHHEAVQDRDRIRTPESEPLGVPQQDRDQGRDQDTLQQRDRIHAPGTAQPAPRPRTAPKPGSGGSRGGGRR